MDDVQLNSASVDPLIECLFIIAKHYNISPSKEDISSLLAAINGKMDYQKVIKAASFLNMTAKLVKATVAKLYSLHLPAILLLQNEKVCVLNQLEKKFAYIVRSSSSAAIDKISIDELRELYSGYCFLLLPVFPATDSKPTKQPKVNWFWHVIFTQLPTYSEIILASFLINVFALASPLFIMNVYDKVVPNQAFVTLWTLAAIVGFVFIFDFILRELRTYFIDNSSRNVETWFSATLFEQLIEIKMADRPPSIGTLINGMQGFDSIKEFLSSTTITSIVDVPFVIIFVLIIAFFGGWLVLIPLVIIPTILVINYFTQLHLTNNIIKISHFNSLKQAALVEALQNIPGIKLSLAEGIMQHRFEMIIDTLADLGVKNRFLTNLCLNLSIFFQYITSIAIVTGGVYRITAGDMRLGALVACTILAGRAISPMTQLANTFFRYRQAKVAYRNINKILKLPVERPPGKQFLSLATFKGEIEFRNVNFSFPSQPQQQLKNIVLHIKPQEHVGIIGLNGSGKSTLLKMIMKLYEPQEGSILIDTIDSNQIDPAELRRFIGYMPQEVGLFQGTIKDNLKLGVFGVDDEQLLNAAALSGLSRLVNQHPEGLQRQIGERGQGLSGGERQLISLTKALLKNPSLLLLDEPTNNMDEIAIQHFTQCLMRLKNKTIVLVVHKLDLLNLVDRLLVMHEGKLVLDGPRDAVLEKLKKSQVSHDKKN